MAQINAFITDQPISSWITSNPALTGVYVYSIANNPGAATANNFVSLFNPVSSTKVVLLAGIFISSYSVGAATSTEPLRGWRVSAASGGTLASNATDVAKFNTAYPTAAPELRTANPTVTLVNPFFNSPPPIGTGAGTAFVHSVEAPPGAGAFLIKPGEGVVVRTASGDVDQTFNISLAWGEIPV